MNMLNQFILLDEIKICEFTSKKYDAIRMIKCTCKCHDENSTIMHFMACCNDGFIEERRYID